MAGPNHYAIGAIVRVRVTGPGEDLEMTRLLTTGISMAGQEPAEAHFGLGFEPRLDHDLTVTIEWPDGAEPTVLAGTISSLSDQIITVGPCSVIDLDGEDGLTFFDLLAYLNRYQAGDMAADLTAPFGTLDSTDLFEAIRLIEAGCP
jgi:hypothetical protein